MEKIILPGQATPDDDIGSDLVLKDKQGRVILREKPDGTLIVNKGFGGVGKAKDSGRKVIYEVTEEEDKVVIKKKSPGKPPAGTNPQP